MFSFEFHKIIDSRLQKIFLFSALYYWKIWTIFIHFEIYQYSFLTNLSSIPFINFIGVHCPNLFLFCNNLLNNFFLSIK